MPSPAGRRTSASPIPSICRRPWGARWPPRIWRSSPPRSPRRGRGDSPTRRKRCAPRGWPAAPDWTMCWSSARAGFLNPPPFSDEPARHKILDLVGDLALLGARLQGYVEVVRGGHVLHLALAREIARRWRDG